MLSRAKAERRGGYLLWSCPQCAKHPEKAMLRQRRRTREKRILAQEVRDGR